MDWSSPPPASLSSEGWCSPRTSCRLCPNGRATPMPQVHRRPKFRMLHPKAGLLHYGSLQSDQPQSDQPQTGKACLPITGLLGQFVQSPFGESLYSDHGFAINFLHGRGRPECGCFKRRQSICTLRVYNPSQPLLLDTHGFLQRGPRCGRRKLCYIDKKQSLTPTLMFVPKFKFCFDFPLACWATLPSPVLQNNWGSELKGGMNRRALGECTPDMYRKHPPVACTPGSLLWRTLVADTRGTHS